MANIKWLLLKGRSITKKQFIKSFAVQKQLEQNHFYAQKNEKKMVHRISTVGIVGNIVLTIFKQVA